MWLSWVNLVIPSLLNAHSIFSQAKWIYFVKIEGLSITSCCNRIAWFSCIFICCIRFLIISLQAIRISGFDNLIFLSITQSVVIVWIILTFRQYVISFLCRPNVERHLICASVLWNKIAAHIPFNRTRSFIVFCFFTPFWGWIPFYKGAVCRFICSLLFSCHRVPVCRSRCLPIGKVSTDTDKSAFFYGICHVSNTICHMDITSTHHCLNRCSDIIKCLFKLCTACCCIVSLASSRTI